MAKKPPQVDIRKLKDEVAEHLKKSRWEKAAEVLEQLVAAEPKDMAQRLKLGETYRRMDQPQLAIQAYQHAAKFFGDEGQLIKAIGAFKIILEIDPRNAEAQKQLAAMNERRIGKVSLARTGLKKGPPPAARPVAPKPEPAAEPANVADTAGHIELPEIGDDEPLELDYGTAAKPPPRGRPQALSSRAQAFSRGAQELSEGAEALAGGDMEAEIPEEPSKPPPRGKQRAIAPPAPAPQVGMDLDPELPPEEPQALPDDAIVGPQAEDLVAAPHDEEVIPGDEFVRQSGPIADLLSSGAEEEVELLSITADEEVAGPRPTAAPSAAAEDTDFDRAFGSIAAPPEERASRMNAKKVPLFDDLPQDAFIALVNRLSYHRHVPDQIIIREGDPGRSFFIIVEGRVRVCKSGPDGKEITLAHLGEGAFFGEMALLSGAPRTANVISEEETELLEVTDNMLRELARKYPQVITSLKNFYRQRLLNNVMAISPLFKDFDPSQRKTIVEKFRMRQAAPEEKIIVEGKTSDGLYVVLHGIVEVSTQQRQVALLKEGEIFGEMSLLTREPASATVSAQTNTILLRLPRDSFQELVVTHPQILALVSELTEKRRTAIEAILEGQGEGHDGMSFV
ncbi:MAG TPA: cyclic nucleotide-binding domain-containing protein [Myxococcales bacterium]|jgi:CRP-like cAMP-binding protein|nr:cyclic nucleotide-binding domain-containing protein [Myxococcales bacterium]